MAVATRKTQSILVVDDEPSIRRMISRVLGETGCSILTAVDAEEALEMLGASRPEVVIADIRLPGMSGVDLAHRIKETQPGVSVLLISAHREPAIHDADGFIGKPFDNDELLDRVRDLIAGR